jgi:hypothetical protein
MRQCRKIQPYFNYENSKQTLPAQDRLVGTSPIFRLPNFESLYNPLFQLCQGLFWIFVIEIWLYFSVLSYKLNTFWCWDSTHCRHWLLQHYTWNLPFEYHHSCPRIDAEEANSPGSIAVNTTARKPAVANFIFINQWSIYEYCMRAINLKYLWSQDCLIDYNFSNSQTTDILLSWLTTLKKYSLRRIQLFKLQSTLHLYLSRCQERGETSRDIIFNFILNTREHFTPYPRFTRLGKTRICMPLKEPKNIFYTISAFYPIG